MFPEELDYTDIRQLPSNWHRFDCFMRSEEKEYFEIPEKLRNRSGKLIYLSMGSMGGADVELMKRLVSILSKSKHRFIVSKGPLHNQYELADNMWGEKTVPQIKVLSVVDLVITHGGNNTFTEICYFGKPMIVMPLFFDQYDNAQRIEEKGFGFRLDPYVCEENELLECIERTLNDKTLALKLEKISKRIQSTKNLLKITELIENLIKK
jgi:UDP:flavonoid glycosyltransferase YjiC (YdhE family)